MGARAKWRIHPALSMLVLYYILTQQLLLYSLLVISLVIHELGHLSVARLLHVKLRKIVLYPFGAQLTFMPAKVFSMLCVTSGGPIATLLLLLLCLQYNWQHLLHFQLLLLIFNGLPIWPLDGGKILFYSLKLLHPKILYEQYITFSFILAITLCVTTLIVQAPLFFLLSSFVLLLESYQSFRARKYVQALDSVFIYRKPS